MSCYHKKVMQTLVTEKCSPKKWWLFSYYSISVLVRGVKTKKTFSIDTFVTSVSWVLDSPLPQMDIVGFLSLWNKGRLCKSNALGSWVPTVNAGDVSIGPWSSGRQVQGRPDARLLPSHCYSHPAKQPWASEGTNIFKDVSKSRESLWFCHRDQVTKAFWLLTHGILLATKIGTEFTSLAW